MANFVIGLLNSSIKGIAIAITALMSLLPNSPFQAQSNSGVSQFMSNVAWILPVSQILVILETWVTAIAVYYVVQIALRWVKAIE